jgi:drug/metabolite transporter (DMT)-like permease
MAIPILGEWPSPIDWTAIVLISVGVYVVSGGHARANASSVARRLTAVTDVSGSLISPQPML